MPTVMLIAGIALFAQSEGAAERDAMLSRMREQAAQTKLTLQDNERTEIAFGAKPLFRYSDEPRGIGDAALWIWHDRGRPVALLKTEYYPRNVEAKQSLLYFVSLAEGTLQADWPGVLTYESESPGLEFRRLSNAPSPADTAAARLVQLRQAARRFSATILRNVRTSQTDVMRMMPTPLERYSSDAHAIRDAALFGLTATGTNPDALIAIEIVSKQGKTAWQYGISRLTLEGLTVKLDDTRVWTCDHRDSGSRFDTSVYFHLPPETLKAGPKE